MRPTPRSRTCSSRPSACPSWTRCSRRAGRDHATSRRSGWPTWSWSTARRSASCNGRPTAPASSAAAAGSGPPVSLIDGRALSNTVGPVLDPIVSLRRRVRLRPGATARVTFSTLVAPSREDALGLADKYHDATTFDRAATLAWTQAQVQLHHLGIGPDEAHLFQSLAGAILYSDRTLRPSADVLTRHTGGRPGPVGPRDLGGHPDRPGPDRRARGRGHRAAAAPRARVLAAEAARRSTW